MTNFRFAGYWPRLLAYNSDLVILLIVFYGFYFILGDSRLLWYVCGVFSWGYYAFFEQSRYQGTPGKQLMKLKTVDYQGEPITIAQAIIRQPLKLIGVSLFFVGILMIAFTKKNQGLHDLIAKTYVIKVSSD